VGRREQRGVILNVHLFLLLQVEVQVQVEVQSAESSSSHPPKAGRDGRQIRGKVPWMIPVTSKRSTKTPRRRRQRKRKKKC
jgi:hypothetical protein